MAILFLYWSMVLIGYFIGSKNRKIKYKLNWTGKILFATILALVFTMGLRMGSNEEVINNLGTIGFEALCITVAVMTGSVLAVTGTRKLLGLDKHAQVKNKAEMKDAIKEKEVSKGGSGKPLTLAILIFVILGMLTGYFLLPYLFTDMNYFEDISGNMLVIGVCLILIFVGINLGLSGTIVTSFKNAGIRVLAFPIAVIFGTLMASLFTSTVLSISAKEAMAISAGFGWYSLAPIIITEQGYVIAGAISFLHNVLREISGIILIPIVAEKIGYIESASLPGVAAMDVCIPLIERSCGESIVIYSFLIGLFQSATVPIIVPIIIGL